MRDEVSHLQCPPHAMVQPAGKPHLSNLLSGFLEELLGRLLLQPLRTGIYQL